MYTEADYKSLSLLFDYVGKKFKNSEEIDRNWGLRINEPLNFPVGGLYAKDFDQAGTEYWFYDGVLSYGMYAWYLLGAVCSVITIKKGKYIANNGSNFILEKNPEAFSGELSVCSRLFESILDLNMKDFDTEADFIKEISRLLEGVATFSSEEKPHEYLFNLNPDVFPKKLVKTCEISFYVSEDKIEAIYLGITDEAGEKAVEQMPSGQPYTLLYGQKKTGFFGFIKRLFK